MVRKRPSGCAAPRRASVRRDREALPAPGPGDPRRGPVVGRTDGTPPRERRGAHAGPVGSMISFMGRGTPLVTYQMTHVSGRQKSYTLARWGIRMTAAKFVRHIGWTGSTWWDPEQLQTTERKRLWAARERPDAFRSALRPELGPAGPTSEGNERTTAAGRTTKRPSPGCRGNVHAPGSSRRPCRGRRRLPARFTAGCGDSAG